MPLLTNTETNFLPLVETENTPHFQKSVHKNNKIKLIGSSSDEEMRDQGVAYFGERTYESPKFFIGDADPKDQKIKEKLVIQTGDGADNLHG